MNAHRLVPLAALLAASCTPVIDTDPVVTRVIAVYDPAAATPVLPLPNDLAIDAATGFLSVPDGDRDSAAQKEFNAYLRGLDGFPTTATPSLTFSGPLDAATLTAANVRVLDMTTANVTELMGAQLEWNASTLTLTLKGLTFGRARVYGVAVLGTAANGLKGSAGEEVIGSPTFALLRARRPLVTCTDLASVECKSATSLIDGTESALTLERARRRLQPGLNYLESKSIRREELAAFWSFSTVTLPLATFDPENEVVPFPNSLAMANGKVNLPAETGDDALTVTLKANLNQLDGFSTSAGLVTEAGDTTGAAEARINASTLSPSQFVLFNLDSPAEEIPLKVECRSCGGNGLTAGTEPDQLALIPQKPMRSHARYGVLWLEGAKGLDGKPVRAGSVFALARSKNALVNADGKSNLGSIDDVSAALLDSLRQTLSPALDGADQKGIAREKIVLAWDFVTQTTTETLAQLRQKPVDWALPTGMVGGPGRTSTLTIPPLVQTLEGFVGQDLTSHLRVMLEGEYSSANALNPSSVETDLTTMLTTPTDGAFTPGGLATPRPETIRFFLVLPNVARGPNGKIPVVLFHHGLGQSRKDAFVIANRIAAEGFATLAIDAPFHGLRSYCLNDNECLGTTCVNHRCADDLQTAGTGYRVRQLQSPFGGTIDDPTETPVNSGRGYISAADLFATRDHFRQEVIDYAQLIRVLNDTTNGIGAVNVDNPATAGVVETLEPANPRYIGQSLGGIAGGLITCAVPEIPSAVLNVAGATQLDIIQYASGFASTKASVDSYLTGRGWPPGSQKYERFLDIGRWVMDPADPQNCGRHFTAEPLKNAVTQQAFPQKRIFLSWTPNDTVVPNYCTEVLERSLERVPDPSLFKNQSYATGGDHAFMLNVLDTQSAAIAITAQTDAVNWVKP